ncbi:MAG TPA: outer membrane beta-barrel protein [Pirellulales bacterium]|nr:outer membrane beta-barrel protein [Pirellulales bacterium]
MKFGTTALACALVAMMAQGATADEPGGDPSAAFNQALGNQSDGPNFDVRAVRYYQAPAQPASPSEVPSGPPAPPPEAAAKKDDGCAKEESCEEKKEEEECKKEECKKCKRKTGCWMLDDFGKSLCKTPCKDCIFGCQKDEPCKKCGEEEPTCKAEEACKAAEEDWTIHHVLEDCNFLKKHDIVIGGWVDQSYTWNPSNPSDHINGPVTWEDQSNQYQLNEFYTYMYKEAKNDGEGRAIGFRVDTLYGTSARFDTSAGLEDHINKSQSFYGLAITQAYVEVAQNDLKAKIGHFISPVGYFTVGSYNNFFNTIPYTYQWGEPFTHTGLLTSWTATDKLLLGGGITRGWDNSGNFNPHAGVLGTATYNGLAKEGDSLAYVTMWSMEPNGGTQPGTAPGYSVQELQSGTGPLYAGKPTFSSRYFQTLVYSRPITDKITYVFQSDFGVQGNASAGTSAGQSVARWYGINQYLYYKVSNQWSWGINGEWFRDEEGFRVGGFLPDYNNTTNGGPSATRGYAAAAPGQVGAGGFAGNFWQFTMGPRWNPYPNVVVRPNFRFDWYSGATGTRGYADPYDAGKLNYQGLFITDLVLVF